MTGFNCLRAAKPLRGESLHFTTNSPGDPGTHLIDLGRMKARVDLQPPSRFETETPELRIQYPKKLI